MRGIAAGLAIVALTGGEAWAHAVERGLILLLPTGYYVMGGALAVALSFLALTVLPAGWTTHVFRPGRRRWPIQGAGAMRWLSFLGFWLLVAAGIEGTRDPLSNPLPLVVWTLLWIGFPLLVAVFGNLGRWLDPWAAPVAVVRRLLGPPALCLPARAGYWPAIAGFGLVVWFEAASVAPDDPALLARAAGLYWLVQFGGHLLFGRRWAARGEAFSVLYRFIARLSPVSRGGMSAPGAWLVHAAPLPLAGWLFVIAAVAGVSFDGLSGTFWWLSRIGVNPLEFPGRSALMVVNSAGLAAVWLALSAAYATTVWAGWELAGRGAPLRTLLGATALSLVPIALAYHLSHYLTYFLVNAQYAMVALSDPFGTGLDLFGWADRPVTVSFLSDLASVEVIWLAQTALIVGGHLLAVLLSDAIAHRVLPDRRAAMLSQVPLAGLMVGLTVLGLWLLSAPTAV